MPPRLRRLIGALAFAFAGAVDAAPGADLQSGMHRFMAATGADVACAISNAPDWVANRLVLWSAGGGARTGAVLWARVDGAGADSPCWSAPGQCVVVEAPVGVPARACVEAARSLRQGASPSPTIAKLFRFTDLSGLRGPLADTAPVMLAAAAGLEGRARAVTFHSRSVPVYVERRGPRGDTVRLALPGTDVRIRRLRVAPASLDLALLKRAASLVGRPASGPPVVELAGTRGVLIQGPGDGHRLITADRCTRLIGPDAMRARLAQASARLALRDGVPGLGAPTRAAYDDLLQPLLEGAVVRGDPVRYGVSQSPIIFLAAPGARTPC